MKQTRFFLLIFFLFAIKLGQTQAVITDMTVTPNAFCTETTIKFDLAINDTVSLVVYDRWSLAIRTYFTNTPLPSGSYSIIFLGDTLVDGIYLVHFSYGDTQQINKQVTKMTCATTSISEATFPKNISLFPNPTNSLLTIPVDGFKTILITNLNGQLYKIVKTQEQVINLSDLAAGSYEASIFTADNKLLARSKFVKE